MQTGLKQVIKGITHQHNEELAHHLSLFLFRFLLKHYNFRSSWWLSWLRIPCCHCCGSGHCCGMGFIPGLGTSACWRQNQQKLNFRLIRKDFNCMYHFFLDNGGHNPLLAGLASGQYSWTRPLSIQGHKEIKVSCYSACLNVTGEDLAEGEVWGMRLNWSIPENWKWSPFSFLKGFFYIYLVMYYTNDLWGNCYIQIKNAHLPTIFRSIFLQSLRYPAKLRSWEVRLSFTQLEE